MMRNTIQILYLGDEPDMITAGTEFFQKKSGPSVSFSFKAQAPGPGLSLADLISSGDCHLVFVDFTHSGIDMDSLLFQIDLLKHHLSYRRIVFAGLMKDKESLRGLSHLEKMGFTYFFIKGNDLFILFQDTYYITFDENPGFPPFASAKDLRLPYKASVPALIREVNAESIKLITDMDTGEDQLELSHGLFEEGRTDCFTVDARMPHSGTGDALSSYLLRIPYPGAWDQEDTNPIHPDTVETYLSRKEQFLPKKRRCLIWGQHDELFVDLLKLKGGEDLQFHFEQGPLEEKIPSLAPELIIIDGVPAGEDEKKFILSLIQCVHLTGYETEPLVIVFRCGLDTDELRQSANYQKLLVHPHPCRTETLEPLLVSHASRPSEETDWEILPFGAPEAMAGINLDVTVTSISEHEITFLCPKELAMYSNLIFDVPVDCHLLIVPPTKELHKRSDNYHYMGFIHGIDQNESNYLRKFVNQIIFSPLKAFERVELSEAKPAPPPEELPVAAEPEKETPELRHSGGRTFRRSFKKSKL